MNKSEFMKALEAQLGQIPKEEAAAALAYYNEYFEDAGEENEEGVLKELGSPENIGAQLKAEIAMKQLVKEEAPTVRKGISAIWLIVLAIFAAPLALPLTVAVLLLALSFVIVVFALLFSLGAVVLAAFLGSIATIVGGLSTLFVSLPNSVFAIGLGMILLGVTLLLAIAVIYVSRILCRWMAKLMNGVLLKMNKGGKIDEQ
ncbi:MAG: DUF1700 domain-containing protein [Anaerovorax sp.]